MEDVVGIRVRDAKRGWVGFMTWGRLWGALDEKPILDAVKARLSTCGIFEPLEIALCPSLRDIQSAEYFYEGLLSFSWSGPAFGADYKEWTKERRKALKEGQELYFVGALKNVERT